MFHYDVIFTDEIYKEISTAHGRVVAASPVDARMRVRNFFPNAIKVSISIELEDNSDGEWDL